MIGSQGAINWENLSIYTISVVLYYIKNYTIIREVSCVENE